MSGGKYIFSFFLFFIFYLNSVETSVGRGIFHNVCMREIDRNKSLKVNVVGCFVRNWLNELHG